MMHFQCENNLQYSSRLKTMDIFLSFNINFITFPAFRHFPMSSMVLDKVSMCIIVYIHLRYIINSGYNYISITLKQLVQHFLKSSLSIL